MSRSARTCTAASPSRCSRPWRSCFSKLAWTAADWRHMGGALACCTKLRANAPDMGAAMRRWRRRGGALGERRATSPMPSRAALRLDDNKIGDEGMRHLGDALARGAAPALKTLDLEIGDEGMRHLSDALAQRRSSSTRSATRGCATSATPSRAARRPRSRRSTSATTPRATPPSKRCRTRSRTASERALAVCAIHITFLPASLHRWSPHGRSRTRHTTCTQEHGGWHALRDYTPRGGNTGLYKGVGSNANSSSSSGNT